MSDMLGLGDTKMKIPALGGVHSPVGLENKGYSKTKCLNSGLPVPFLKISGSVVGNVDEEVYPFYDP